VWKKFGQISACCALLYRNGSTKVLNGPKVDLDCIGETFYIEHGELSRPTQEDAKAIVHFRENNESFVNYNIFQNRTEAHLRE
jgi:hypothetical protein